MNDDAMAAAPARRGRGRGVPAMEAPAPATKGKSRGKASDRCSAPWCRVKAVTGGLCSVHAGGDTPCSVEGCTAAALYEVGMCKRHASLTAAGRPLDGSCAIEGCEKEATAGKLCSTHYGRVRRGLSPEKVAQPGALKPKVPRLPRRKCPVPGCERNSAGLKVIGLDAEDMCVVHAKRLAAGRPLNGLCIIEGCDRPGSSGRGLCNPHALRYKHGHDLEPPIRQRRSPVVPRGVCGVDGCGRVEAFVGLCRTHYNRKKRGFPPLDAPVKPRTEAPCGTAGGASRHYRLKEEVCDACRVAYNEVRKLKKEEKKRLTEE